MIFRLFVLFFISPLFFGWSFQSAFSHSLSSVVDTLAFHVKEGSSLKVVRQDVVTGLESFKDSLPRATKYPRAMRKKKRRNPQSYGGGKSFPVDTEMDLEARRRLLHIISAKTLGELKKRYARHQAFLGKGEGLPASPKMRTRLRRLGVSVPVENPKVDPELSLKAVFGGSDPIDRVVSYLDPESAAALPQVNRSLLRWSKASTSTSASKGRQVRRSDGGGGSGGGGVGGAGASEGTAESKGAALDAVVAASAGEGVSAQNTLRMLRSQKELAQVFSMTEIQLGVLEGTLKTSAPDRQVLNRAGLGRRLDAVQQVVAAEKNYQQSLRAEANASVQAFIKDPLNVQEGIPAEANRTELFHSQRAITQIRVAAIEALEKEGVIVPSAPSVKAQGIYWRILSEAEVNHWNARLQARQAFHLLEAKQGLDMAKINQVSTSVLAAAEGNLAYHQALIAGAEEYQARLAKFTARAKVLKKRKGSALELATAEGDRAQYQALIDGKTNNQAGLERAETRVKILKSRKGPVSKLADAEGVRAYYQALIDGKTDNQGQLERMEARAKILKSRKGSVSKLADVEGLRAYYQALIDGKKKSQADLEKAEVRLKILKRRKGSVSKLAGAERQRATHQARVNGKNPNEAILEGTLVSVEILKRKKGPVSKLADEEGVRAYHQAVIDGKNYNEAGLERALASIEILESRKGPVSKLADAEGLRAYYQALIDRKINNQAGLEGAIARIKVLRTRRGATSEIAAAEGNRAYYQALIDGKADEQLQIEELQTRIRFLRKNKKDFLKLTQAEKELDLLQLKLSP